MRLLWWLERRRPVEALAPYGVRARDVEAVSEGHSPTHGGWDAPHLRGHRFPRHDDAAFIETLIAALEAEDFDPALVKALIPNPDAKLRGGMFASLELTLRVRDSVIVIPEPAIMSNGDNFSVFVVDKDGKAQVRPIQVGLRLPGKAEVLKGLNAGDKVVVEGIQKLRPGGPVKLAPPEAAAPYVKS